jgi:peroxiredoxin Q/BCP
MMTSLLGFALGALVGTGTPAPDFSAPDQAAQVHTLKDLKGKWVVLYFYPKDETKGCTLEARNFRDLQAEFDKAGAVVLGVSSQDVKSHEAFAKAEQLGFPLLDDHDRTIAKAYGVGQVVPLTGLDSRVTFLIGKDGVVRQVWPDVDPKTHAKEVLGAIQAAK